MGEPCNNNNVAKSILTSAPTSAILSIAIYWRGGRSYDEHGQTTRMVVSQELGFQQSESESFSFASLRYVHCDGAWAARQVEWQGDQKPILLMAGRDDDNLRKLSLRETGLELRRGSEIGAVDFDEV